MTAHAVSVARSPLPIDHDRAVHPLSFGEPISDAAFAQVRRRMILECCKWDPQVGDISTLASYPLLIERADWRTVESLAESLAQELLATEHELVNRPDLWGTLAIPRPLRRTLVNSGNTRQPGARVLRFDFHWTDDGWRISEVNSDVPGGYAEGSAFPRLMAAHIPHVDPAGDPASAWADAFTASIDAGSARDIALLAATGFMEDQQVLGYLGRTLATRGFTPHFADPNAIKWSAGCAKLQVGSIEIPISGIVRFYQAEWVGRLPCRVCEPLFSGNGCVVTNPGSAVLTESKRFPLVWDRLSTPLPTWRRLLPETRNPRDVNWRNDDWLVKSAFCNTGDTVAGRDLVTAKRWKSSSRLAWMFPGRWIAQRRFETSPLRAPNGDVMYPCLGVFTVNGKAAGAYARLSHGPIVDYRAIDAAVLVRRSSGEER